MKSILLATILLFSCAPQREVVLVNMNADALLMKIKSYSGKKAVLVNFWATWCPPCIKEFPDLVKLSKDYEKDLEVIFLSFDFPEQRQNAIDFLRKQKLLKESYFKSGSDQAFFKKLPEAFSGALPFTMIYDKKGNLKESLKGKHRKDVFESYIKQALN